MKIFRSLLLPAATSLATLLPFGASAQAPQPPAAAATQLRLTSPVRLVDCAPVAESPCLSVGLTPSDSAGNPAPVALPAPSELAGAIELQSGSTTLKPFFAAAGLGPDAAQHTNVVLLMVDISGSMNQLVPGGLSRFAAVKDAISRYVGAMQEGSDRIAIVPFESHSVVPTIRNAVFASRRQDALAQLNAIPQPTGRNNTALYQAVFSGVQAMSDELQTLRREGHSPEELQPHIIVMTDGKNEVRPGDDPLLLDGPLGLQQAVAQVQSSHIDVIGVGFGERSAIDAAALQRLSTRFFYAADANQLLDALHVSRSLQSHEILLTAVLPEANRLALSGRDQAWTPSLSLQGSPAPLSGAPVRSLAPATAAPHFDRKASATELEALINTHPPSDSGWSVVLVNLLLLLAALALLLALWFWVPRLIWGDRYGETELPASRKWSIDRPATTAASGVKVRYTDTTPPGFEPETTGPLQRSAAQTTQVKPRGEFSRTRLTFDSK